MSLADQTLKILEIGIYEIGDDLVDISQELAFSASNTHVLRGEALEPAITELLRGVGGVSSGALEVTGEVSAEAARRLSSEGRVALLNFASGRRPGGGFLNDARAQEEELCRCSGLYPTLLTQPEFYLDNRMCSAIYTDQLIFSPQVPFFKVDSRMATIPYFLADVITMPAPNSKTLDTSSLKKIPNIFQRRWAMILCTCYTKNIRNLVLGAWGCGAFGNDPLSVASAFSAVWLLFRSHFDTVVFAIPPGTNHQVFREVLIS